MAVGDYRVSKLRDYLFDVINALTTDNDYQINSYNLSGEVGNYSLDKIPTDTETDRFVISLSRYQEVYSLRSRKVYSQKAIENLKNIGFFEDFERKIRSNNDKGILPDIKNIESIECLNCGTMVSNDNGNTGTFDIQIQITYLDDNEEEILSL